MNRAQRRAHRLIWWVLAPLLLSILGWAVVDRWVYPEQPRVEDGASP